MAEMTAIAATSSTIVATRPPCTLPTGFAMSGPGVHDTSLRPSPMDTNVHRAKLANSPCSVADMPAPYARLT